MNRFAVGALAVLSGLGASAVEEIVFPNAAGSGDLTSEESWGGGVPTNKRPNIQQAGDYFFGNDITFAGLRFADFANGGTATMTATGRKVTLGADLDVRHEHSVRFEGGLYDFQTLYKSAYGTWNDSESQRWDVNVELDGCVFTNMAGFCTGYYQRSGGNFWTLKNGAGMYVGKEFWLGYDDKGQNTMEVLSGSRLVVGDASAFPRNGASSQDSVLHVSGEGSYFKTGSDFSCGAKNFNLLVDDGARAEIGGGYWYYKNIGNTIRVDGSASSMAIGPLYVSSGSVSNRIVATDGATMTLSPVYLNTCDAFGVVVSNATATLNGNIIAQENQFPSNCYIRVAGEHAVFTSPVYGLRFGGTGTDVLATDGAQVSIGKSDGSITLGGTACALRAAGEGTTLDVTLLYSTGNSNRLESVDGAELKLQNVWFNGCKGNEILVSNATLNVVGEGRSFAPQDAYSAQDTTIRVSGENATFASGTGFRLGGTATRVVVENGASATVGTGYYYIRGTSNSVCVAGTGSTVTTASTYPSGTGHCYEAVDGGTLTVPQIYLGNVDGFGLVLSNGTINVKGFQRESAEKQVANPYVAIRGDHPALNVGENGQGGLSLSYGLQLRYTLPVDGYAYADDRAPIELNVWCPGDETATVVIENAQEIVDDLRRNKIAKRTYRLLHAPKGFQGLDISRLNESMPEGCSLVWNSGYLLLTVKIDLGTVLIFR